MEKNASPHKIDKQKMLLNLDIDKANEAKFNLRSKFLYLILNSLNRLDFHSVNSGIWRDLAPKSFLLDEVLRQTGKRRILLQLIICSFQNQVSKQDNCENLNNKHIK